MAWTTADLISAVRRQAFMPDVADLVDSTRGQFTDAELLAIADEEIASSFVDHLRALRDESRVTYEDTACTGARMRIELPERAMVRGVRRVHYVTADGVEGQEIPAIMPADAWQQSPGVFLGSEALVRYFEADDIVLPTSPTSGWIRVYYQRQLPRLALVSDCAQIESIAGLVATVDATPWWVAIDQLVDVVRGSSPFQALDTDLEVGASTGTTITLTTWPHVADVVQSGGLSTLRQDYICARDTTCCPPLPREWHAALYSCVVVRVLEAVGDMQAIGAARDLRDRRIDAMVRASTPRDVGRTERIVNRASNLRSPRRWWWR